MSAIIERLLISYARRFPLDRGKLRLVNTAWKAAAGADCQRIATTLYGGLRMPCDLNEALQRQFYFFGTYFVERHLLARWHALARNAAMVFDVGANVGIYSLAALGARRNAIVHAFEPTPEIAERLRQTKRLNDLDGLHIHQVAILRQSGAAKLHRYTPNDNGGQNFVRASSVDGEAVEAVSLDDFCARRQIAHIDLLKIDVQGNEASVLAGAEGILKAGAVKSIFVELNWWSAAGATPAEECIEQLAGAGYQFTGANSIDFQPPGAWLRQHSDVIAQKP